MWLCKLWNTFSSLKWWWNSSSRGFKEEDTGQNNKCASFLTVKCQTFTLLLNLSLSSAMIPVKNCSWCEVKKCLKEKKMLDYSLITTALWFPFQNCFTHILLVSILQRIRKNSCNCWWNMIQRFSLTLPFEVCPVVSVWLNVQVWFMPGLPKVIS